jgi:hypothetical protein
MFAIPLPKYKNFDFKKAFARQQRVEIVNISEEKRTEKKSK